MRPPTSLKFPMTFHGWVWIFSGTAHYKIKKLLPRKVLTSPGKKLITREQFYLDKLSCDKFCLLQFVHDKICKPPLGIWTGSSTILVAWLKKYCHVVGVCERLVGDYVIFNGHFMAWPCKHCFSRICMNKNESIKATRSGSSWDVSNLKEKERFFLCLRVPCCFAAESFLKLFVGFADEWVVSTWWWFYHSSDFDSI